MNREIHTISGFALDREGQPAPTLSVQIGSLAGFSKDDGSWSRRVYAGDVTLELRGGGLPGPVTVSVAVNRDIRLDVIGGDTLLTDASITAVGPFERVERIGAADEEPEAPPQQPDGPSTRPEFNPSGNPAVARLKVKTEELLGDIMVLLPESRERAIAIANIEQGCMWAVKAATK